MIFYVVKISPDSPDDNLTCHKTTIDRLTWVCQVRWNNHSIIIELELIFDIDLHGFITIIISYDNQIAIINKSERLLTK